KHSAVDEPDCRRRIADGLLDLIGRLKLLPNGIERAVKGRQFLGPLRLLPNVFELVEYVFLNERLLGDRIAYHVTHTENGACIARQNGKGGGSGSDNDGFGF